MEIVGGFMMMISIIGFFLAVVWLIMPFVVFAVKGKQDRMLDVLESVEKRLAAIEVQLQRNEVLRRGVCVDSTGGSGLNMGAGDTREQEVLSVAQNSGGM